MNTSSKFSNISISEKAMYFNGYNRINRSHKTL